MPPLAQPIPAPWTTDLVQFVLSADGQRGYFRDALDADAPWLPATATTAALAPREQIDPSHLDASPRQLELLAPEVDRLGGLALVRHDHRSSSPVHEVVLLPWCPGCIDGDVVETAADAGLYALPVADRDDLHAVTVLCSDHVRLAGKTARPLALAELAAALGAKVGWADQSAIAATHPLIARRRWSGQARGPLLAERPVSDLRMGQVGYVPPGAIRLDGQRWVLLVDLDAPAPQRPTGPCMVAVRRTVHLGYEVFVGIDDADRYDLAWSLLGPPVIGRNEAKVTDVRGLWATPLLATALGRQAEGVGIEGPVRRGRYPRLAG